MPEEYEMSPEQLEAIGYDPRLPGQEPPAGSDLTTNPTYWKLLKTTGSLQR